MSADTAIGTVRTYARIREGDPFTYQSWMDAVRRAETFVTYGPLIDSRWTAADGQPVQDRGLGRTFDVSWTRRA